jgi:hypothetical protein
VRAPDVNGKPQVTTTIGGVTAPASWPTVPRSRTWPAVTLACLAVVLAAAALIVSLTRPTSQQGGPPPAPSFTTADTTSAKEKMCDAFTVAAQAVRLDSARDPVLGRLALINGAGMLDAARTPALPADLTAKAADLASTYRAAAAATASSAPGSDDPGWKSSAAAVEDATTALKSACQ